jgi:predicted N-acetyltransferase YhbS
MAIYPIRPVAEDELAGFLAVDQHASHGTPLSQRAHANLLARLEFDRTLAAIDGDTIIGTAGVFSFQMRVPGAMAAVAGVSLVAVLPSHRRQGILSALMRRQLADVKERDEAVAVLFCSESGIYGRYGYRRASWQAAYRLRRNRRARHRPGGRARHAPRPAGCRRALPPALGRAHLLALPGVALGGGGRAPGVRRWRVGHLA